MVLPKRDEQQFILIRDVKTLTKSFCVNQLFTGNWITWCRVTWLRASPQKAAGEVKRSYVIITSIACMSDPSVQFNALPTGLSRPVPARYNCILLYLRISFIPVYFSSNMWTVSRPGVHWSMTLNHVGLTHLQLASTAITWSILPVMKKRMCNADTAFKAFTGTPKTCKHTCHLPSPSDQSRPFVLLVYHTSINATNPVNGGV